MTKKQKKSLVKIIVSVVLCAAFAFLPINDNIKLLLFLIPYFIVGSDVLFGAFKNIINGSVFDERFLMTVATVGAFIIGEHLEAVAVMIFYQTGELFQSIAVGKSRRSIKNLMNIRPDTAYVLRDGKEITVAPEEVEKGEILIIRAGEKIPLDGIIIDGNTSVDTSSLTGESIPCDKAVGDTVISGTVNLSGVIRVEATGAYSESTVAKILTLVETAAEKKAKTESFITRFAKYYTPAVVLSAVALAVVPPLFLGGWINWINRALIFLVVSCPCALVVSVPLSFFGGIGGASKKGILIKGANIMESLAKIDTVVFDKTGTLTEGKFKVTEVNAVNCDKETLLKISAAAESRSNHPIAVCIAEYCQACDVTVQSVTELAGMGLCAQIDGEKYYLGNTALMKKIGADFVPAKGGTVVFVAKENQFLGSIVIGDSIKAEAKKCLISLKNIGIKKTVMLTGDNAATAHTVAQKIGIDEYKAELLPDEKVTEVEALLQKGKKVAFVGDGINDAPVLTRADVGIAMGAMGSDAAIEAADVVIMDDKLSKLSSAIKISRRTLRIVKQNIVFALSVKGLILILSGLGLANMWIGVFGDVGVTVLAILNAMRTLFSENAEN